MFIFSSTREKLFPRCRAITLVLLAGIVSLGFSTVTQAQTEHGAAIGKSCQSPVRVCDTPEDCTDGNECTTESCDTETFTRGTLECTWSVTHDDDFNDTLSIEGAFDTVKPFTAESTRVPAAGSAPIIAVSGNTTCVVGAFVPCNIGPDLGAGPGSVSFQNNPGYNPVPGDPDPLPDQATVLLRDLCDGIPSGDCNSTAVNPLSFGAVTTLVDGCTEPEPIICDDGDACTTEACNPNTGECETTDTVSCDDGDACTTESCNPNTGECETTDTVSCDDGDACTTESCNPNTGECETTDTVSCDDGDACTTESCNPNTGECETTDTVSCDDGDVCTDDFCNPNTGECEFVPAEPLPAECVGAEICRTPGFWGARGGDEKAPKSQNVTQAVIDAAGGLDVCGTTITNTDLGDSQSAIEAICVAVKGDLERQLVRQLTAAALNCALADCTEYHSDLVADCNSTCADATGTRTVNECIDELDCFNNGGAFDSELGCTFPGACELSTEACVTDEDCPDLGDFCVPSETCHDRDLCPDLTDDEEINGSDFCFEPLGPASSPAKCNAARKNDVYVP
jgi:hypothetical protein